MKIASWINGSVLFKDDSKSIKSTMEAAIKSGANLSGADLSGAYLYCVDIG